MRFGTTIRKVQDDRSRWKSLGRATLLEMPTLTAGTPLPTSQAFWSAGRLRGTVGSETIR